MEENVKLPNNEDIKSSESVKQIPWIFFDYSGTLVDTVNTLAKVYTKFFGKDFTQEKVKNLYKDHPKYSKLGLMLKYKLNPLKMIFGGKKKFEEIRKEEFWVSVRAFPGIPEVLFRLKRMFNIKIAIVTHEVELIEPEEREKILQRYGIPNIFDEIVADYYKKEKSFETFWDEKKIQKGIFVSDTQFDLDMGKEYNLDTIGVTWGFSKRDELKADYIIDDPRELLQAVTNIMHKIEQITKTNEKTI